MYIVLSYEYLRRLQSKTHIVKFSHYPKDGSTNTYLQIETKTLGDFQRGFPGRKPSLLDLLVSPFGDHLLH